MANPVSSLGQGFPSISMPFVDPDTGIMNQTWYQFLIAMFNRTGQGQGISPFDIGTLAVTAGDNQTLDVPTVAAFDVGGAEPIVGDPATLALAFADDASGSVDITSVFDDGITVYGGAAIFGGAAISGGLYIVDNGINIHAGGETVNGGLVVFGGGAVGGGWIVTSDGIAVTGDSTISGSESITGSLNVTGGVSATTGGFAGLNATNFTVNNETVSGSLVSTGNAAASNLLVSSLIAPVTTNSIPDGLASNRWTTIYLVNNPDVSSDARGKVAPRALPAVGELVDRIRPLSFARKDDPTGRRHAGFLAQELQGPLQSLGLDIVSQGADGMLGLAEGELVAVLWKALAETRAEVRQLKGQV